MIKKFFFLLTLFPVLALSQELVSRHNTMYKALENAINSQCGTELSIVQSPGFNLYSDGTVKDLELNVECTKKKEVPGLTVKVDYPTTRVNGQPISHDEIKHVLIDYNRTLGTVSAIVCDVDRECSSALVKELNGDGGVTCDAPK